MSLNGLDDDAVVKAHQAAVAEAGGWFLLKYATRDTVELLDNGNAGVAEARGAVEQYEEKSPLYGLVHYRRKKVILKYVPEGTSRLLQVRLAVQFQSILDMFVPHDTVFSFTIASELTDSALGLATMRLQSAPSLTSSTSSLRQRRLNGIVEDAEEGPDPAEEAVTDPASDEPSAIAMHQEPEAADDLPASAVKAKALLAAKKEREATEEAEEAAREAIEERRRARDSHATIKHSDTIYPPRKDSYNASSSVSAANVAYNTTNFPPLPQRNYESDSDDEPRAVLVRNLKSLDEAPRASMDRAPPDMAFSRHLTAAESSSISRWTDDVLASTLPNSKRKSSAKPSAETSRPKTSGNADQPTSATNKRVAGLPNSIRVSARPPSALSQRPGSQHSTRSVPARFVPSPNLPPPLPSPMFSPPGVQHPMTSRTHQQPSASAAFDEPAVAPEKLRLMKALQMRKRNQLMSQRASSAMSQRTENFDKLDRSMTSSSARSRDPAPSVLSSVSEQPAINNDQNSMNVSDTTSPTSAGTQFDNSSTKPSSLSELSHGGKSETSLALETNSSTTPKAETAVSHTALDDGSRASRNDTVALDALATKSAETIEPPKLLAELSADVSSSDPRAEATSENAQSRTPEQPPVPLPRPSQDRSDQTMLPDTRAPQNLNYLRIRQAKRRSQFGGSIIIPASGDFSDLSDSESFMDELQNATVHEATPVSVARTPITPVLSKHSDKHREASYGSVGLSREDSKSPGTTPDRRRIVSRAGSARSVSSALPQWPPAGGEPPVPALPKIKAPAGTIISKRVKALEDRAKDEKPISPSTSVAPSPQKGLTFSGMLKRASIFSHGTAATSGSSDKTTPKPSPLAMTATEEVDNVPEEPISGRLLVQRPGSSAEVYTPSHKGESVSITARIIRDDPRPRTSAAAIGDASISNMHRSPLIIEHEPVRSEKRLQASREPSHMSNDSSMKSPTLRGRRFSLASHRSQSKTMSPPEANSSRISLSGARKSIHEPSETSSIVEDKKASRTSRMLKRLSSIGQRKNKGGSISSPTRENLHAETISERFEDSRRHSLAADSMLQVVDVGEVNVQFPGSLLWKRRFLRVDDQGRIIFAPPANDFSTRGKTIRYHLSEFYVPSLPDPEREEMAWSIMLDLKDGKCVQCACQDRRAQRDMLKMLVDAHSAYAQLFGE